ncbi:MAG: acyl-CoA thioesterase [Anaerolineae bacterium]
MGQKRIVESSLRVRYAETDAMGVVYHSNYLVWFEVGRGDYFRELGQDYGQWELRGYLLPVAEAYARYHAPARFGDEITVRTWVEQVRSRSLTLGYEVVRADTRLRLVTGWTRHICTDGNGQACRLPLEMLEPLEPS